MMNKTEAPETLAESFEALHHDLRRGCLIIYIITGVGWTTSMGLLIALYFRT